MGTGRPDPRPNSYTDFVPRYASVRIPSPGMARDTEFDDVLLSIPEAVDALRIRPSHLYKLMQENTIRPLRLGRRTLIPRSEIRRLIAQATAR